MRKPLQADETTFAYLEVDGSSQNWLGAVDPIVRSAKKSRNFAKNAKNLRPTSKDVFDSELYRLLAHYHQFGLSNSLESTLNRRLKKVRFRSSVHKKSNGKPVWRHVPDFAEIATPQAGASYAFAQLLCAGYLDKLRKCENPPCDRFFLGRSNSKWCCATCGSIVRVHRKRRKDRLG